MNSQSRDVQIEQSSVYKQRGRSPGILYSISVYIPNEKKNLMSYLFRWMIIKWVHLIEFLKSLISIIVSNISGCTSFCLRHSAFSQTAFVKLPWRHTAFGTYYIEDKLPFCHMTLRTNYILVFLSSVHIAFKTRGGGGEQSQFFMDETDTKKLLTI